MAFPPLESDNWQTTIQALHQATMLYGPIHNALRVHQNNYLHLPVFGTPDGLSSGQYANQAQLDLNFRDGTMIYSDSAGQQQVFSLADHTQASLLDAVLEVMRADVLAEFFETRSEQPLINYLLDTIRADESKTVFLQLDDVTGSQSLAHDRELATAYAEALDTVLTGVARFRARLGGHLTPIVVWSEHFDLSTLWFADPEMDEHQTHINIGFAPYTPDLFDYPYLYAYLYPYPDGFIPNNLPSGAQWRTEGFKGVVVPYDALVKAHDPIELVEHLSRDIFDALYQGVLRLRR
ncbi:MAG: DUF5996 family protein [Anaerolineae bacterium]